MTLYKVLGEDMRSCHGGDHIWTPGEWTPPVDPRMCKQGWHLCRGTMQLLEWLGPQIWVAEARGKILESDDKICVESCRIVRRIDAWYEDAARWLAYRCLDREQERYADQADVARRRGYELTVLAYRRQTEACSILRRYLAGAVGTATLSKAWPAAHSEPWRAARAAADANCHNAAKDAAAGVIDSYGELDVDASPKKIEAWNAAWIVEREWQAGVLQDLLGI